MKYKSDFAIREKVQKCKDSVGWVEIWLSVCWAWYLRLTCIQSTCEYKEMSFVCHRNILCKRAFPYADDMIMFSMNR